MFKAKKAKVLFVVAVMLFAASLPFAAQAANNEATEPSFIQIVPFGGCPPEPPRPQ